MAFPAQVCTQTLTLPDGINIVSATMAAGHLSSSSIYPACFAPYLITTACTDGRVRFWKCNTAPPCEENGNVTKYEWCEWKMMIQTEGDSSNIRIPGQYRRILGLKLNNYKIAHSLLQ